MAFLIQTPSQLAVHLRALRTAKGWRQEQLGLQLGLSQARIARIEKDPLNVSVGQFLKVLSALDARMSVIVNPNPNPNGMGGDAGHEVGADLGTPGTTESVNTDKSNQGNW